MRKFSEFLKSKSKKELKKNTKSQTKETDDLLQPDQAYVTFKTPPIFQTSVTQPAGGAYSGTGY